ncbi:ROK family transcriptional regulator [Actinoplanes aureus]|uniref:ROK family transcriptional regulator n=1 Tax=Actinoplanes aureus TaxID=2792083 RepID=A0A931CJW9_9ACTN|nr:ROK family transcriptional regulator [Actinoplanes aureus]MBG0569032.1 ROK family transcriptional regulator [Actinoplanes aureus]
MSAISAHPGLRGGNHRRVVHALRRHGALTRAALADGGLSRSTVTAVVAELLETGLLIEISDPARDGRATGRPPTLVRLNGELGVTVGVEIANGIVRAAVCDVAQELLAHDSIATDDQADPRTTLAATSTLIDELLERTGFGRDRVIGVGLAVPGPIQRRTGLTGRACTLKPWAGINPSTVATEVLHLPALADNDANLAALAELTWGAARGLRDYAYIYTAKGIGAGFVINGEIYAGANGTAGEIGHTTLNEDGLVCECGGRGCLNTLANPDAIAQQLWQIHGRRLRLAEVIDLAQAGDAGCRRVLADAGRHIGVAMANMYNLLDPELIVIGGNLAAAGAMLIDPLHQSMVRRAIHAGEAVPAVVAGALDPETVVVVGAAAAVLRDSATFPLPA